MIVVAKRGLVAARQRCCSRPACLSYMGIFADHLLAALTGAGTIAWPRLGLHIRFLG